MTSLLNRIALTILSLLAWSSAHANPPVHMCNAQKAERASQPFHEVRGGKLVSLLGRKLKPPVAYRNGTFRNIDLLHGPHDVYKFPYPGELYIMDTATGKRIIHNHHVLTDGTYSAKANGWWVIDIEASGRSLARGFNESMCYFRRTYQPEK